MWIWFKKKIKVSCECEAYCPCGKTEAPHCENCKYYRMWDSGYGYCIALPEAVLVPWCKIPCSLFKD